MSKVHCPFIYVYEFIFKIFLLLLSLVSFGNPKYLTKVIDCYLKAMDEYTLDNRGDIGAWVREAAMNGSCALVFFVLIYKR